MHNPAIVIFRNFTDSDFSITSWKEWAKKYNYPVYELPVTNSIYSDAYNVDLILETEGIDYDSILITTDTTYVMPTCTNFINKSNKLLHPRWFGSFGDILKLKSILKAQEMSIDNWISMDMIFFPKQIYKKICEDIKKSNILTIIENNVGVLKQFSSLVDIPINFIRRDETNEYELTYDYNMCNMHINELLNNTKFLNMNPKIVNFNNLDRQSTLTLLHMTKTSV